jgi:hypothetical protein
MLDRQVHLLLETIFSPENSFPVVPILLPAIPRPSFGTIAPEFETQWQDSFQEWQRALQSSNSDVGEAQ